MAETSILIITVVFFLIAERIFPARTLPNSPGWYLRAIFLNACQLGVVFLAGLTWNKWFSQISSFNIAKELSIPLQGFFSWFVGTFVFYWWHRARHDVGLLWRSLHQIHHSASRIEILTAYYKHPLEMIANSVIISVILFVFLGAAPEAALWFNLFATIGEFFYHSNLKTPHWIGYVVQRPEHHSIHHQFEVHKYNFADLTWWDRMFGTFKDAKTFVPRSGFTEGREQMFSDMLLFKDVY